MKKSLGLSFLLLVAALSNAYATPAEIILIRHGEKPTQGNELNQRGWQRAYALVDFFTKNPAVTRFGVPIAIYPMAQAKPGSSVRAIQTITPLAEALSERPHADFTREEYPAAAREILTNPAYDGKMVLICWEHKVIPDFAARLGLRGGPTDWDGSVFDRAWVLDYSGDRVARFRDLPQHLLPGDSSR